MFNFNVNLNQMSVEDLAVYLLLAGDRNIENNLKEEAEKTGMFKCAVTEVGANAGNIKSKIVSSAIGASLDCGIINKIPHQIHALLQAVEQALRSILDANILIGNVGLKLSIVRDSQWIVVGIYGSFSAYHMVNQKRISLGIMHISY